MRPALLRTYPTKWWISSSCVWLPRRRCALPPFRAKVRERRDTPHRLLPLPIRPKTHGGRKALGFPLFRPVSPFIWSPESTPDTGSTPLAGLEGTERAPGSTSTRACRASHGPRGQAPRAAADSALSRPADRHRHLAGKPTEKGQVDPFRPRLARLRAFARNGAARLGWREQREGRVLITRVPPLPREEGDEASARDLNARSDPVICSARPR